MDEGKNVENVVKLRKEATKMFAATLSEIKQRVKKIEKTIELLDGKKTMKPRKKKVYTIGDLPTTRGFGGVKVLKDGVYGDISVVFGKILTKPPPDPEADRQFLLSLKEKMIERFGRFRMGMDELDYIEVDNSHLRKRRKE